MKISAMESTRQMLQKLELTVQYLDWQLAKQRNIASARWRPL